MNSLYLWATGITSTMCQELKNRVLALARKSKITEMDQLLKSENINWSECRYASGDSPLHTAAQCGNISIVRYLLETPCSNPSTVDVTNLSGKTALHEACQNSQPEVVSFLLSKGANARAIKQADWTPLMLACTKRGEKALACCRLLLENAGSVLLDDKNKDGWNALHIASREGDISIVKELLQANPSSMQACMKSNNGRTPLHTAALHGCHLVVEHLLQTHSVDCNAKDSCGSTPLHDAVRSGCLETFNAFVKAEADLTVTNNQGYGVVHMAAQAGQVVMLQYLLKELGPVARAETNLKTTPLHSAVRAGQTQSAEILLRSGADPNIKDSWGRSCHDILPEMNVQDIKRILDTGIQMQQE